MIDEIDLWRQIRLLHEWHYRLAVSVGALRQLAEESGFLGRMLELEIKGAQESSQIHAESLRLIDEKIQMLVKSQI